MLLLRNGRKCPLPKCVCGVGFGVGLGYVMKHQKILESCFVAAYLNWNNPSKITDTFMFNGYLRKYEIYEKIQKFPTKVL